MQIRPVSDLRNRFTEIEKAVQDGEPVYLTKNGYGTMVVMSLESYEKLTKGVKMMTLVFNKAEDLRPEIKNAIKAAEASENITSWTVRAKLGKAVPQEMQLLSAFLKKHGLNVEEFLENVSVKAE